MSINDQANRRAWSGEERRRGHDDDYTGAERRRRGVSAGDLHSMHVIRRFESIEDRLDRGSDRMKAIEIELHENTKTTKEVRELLELGRNGFKVLGYLGTAAKWVTAIAAAVAAVWTLYLTFKNGGPPPSPPGK